MIEDHRRTISQLRPGDVFSGQAFTFDRSQSDQIYIMTELRGVYVSLKTGKMYHVRTCCPDARVTVHLDAEVSC
jgi:hypothetical protein